MAPPSSMASSFVGPNVAAAPDVPYRAHVIYGAHVMYGRRVRVGRTPRMRAGVDIIRGRWHL